MISVSASINTALLYSVCYRKHGLCRKVMSNYSLKNMKLISNKISEKMTVKKHETKKNGRLKMKSSV